MDTESESFIVTNERLNITRACAYILLPCAANAAADQSGD